MTRETVQPDKTLGQPVQLCVQSQRLCPPALCSAGGGESQARRERIWAELLESEGLAPQQRLVVARLMEGKADKQIARVMGISTVTVRTHLTRVFARTGTADRVELILYLVRQFCLRCQEQQF